MKSKIGAFVFLTAILLLSAAATGVGNTMNLHVRIQGEKDDVLTIPLEMVSKTNKTLTLKITDVDMSLFQYHFAIAKAVKAVDFTITDVKPGYYIITVSKKALKKKGRNDYILELPASVLKENISTVQFTEYMGSDSLMVNVYADNKFMRSFIAAMGIDIASVNLEGGYMTCFVSSQELLALSLAGFDIEVVSTGDASITELEPEYYTYPEVVNELPQIETDHPSIAKTFSIGTSYEGRDIPGIKISDNVATNESEAEVFICAMHHAREAATVNVAMHIINYLTDNYGSDPDVTTYVDTREIYIVPIVNPDGKVYDDGGGSYGSGRNWRKNRQPCDGGIGTDPNRNYGYQWGGSGSSGYCTSDTFRGYDPFDAPCTAAVRDFVNAHPDINLLVTYHSYGDLVLWPWGYTYDPIADENDRKVHEILGQGYASYTGYTPQQASDLYIADGTTDDWGYGATQNDAMPCFSWTVELAGGGFYPSPSVLPTMCADNMDGIMYLLEYADDPYSVLPDVLITNPSENETVSGTVTVTTDCSAEVASVEFYVDGSLQATDNTSPFSWDWDTTQWSDASHTVTAKGYDSGSAYIDEDSVNVTVDNSGGDCLGTVLLGILILFGSTAVFRKE
ncbi:MAG: M14 family zinc carboxypeptidase [Candidatus Methanofastidiosia archaeon]